VNEKRLGEARHADDEAIAAREQRQQHELDDVLLTDDQLAELGDDRVMSGLQATSEIEVI